MYLLTAHISAYTNILQEYIERPVKTQEKSFLKEVPSSEVAGIQEQQFPMTFQSLLHLHKFQIKHWSKHMVLKFKNPCCGEFGILNHHTSYACSAKARISSADLFLDDGATGKRG